jgi:hypothetical protein
MELGRNDIEQFGLTASLVETSVKSIVGRYVSAGKRVWCFTIPPTTYSNDAWVTAANQSFPSAAITTGTSATPSGAVQVVMSSLSGISVGQSVALNLSTLGAIAPGSIVTAINTATSTITLSVATTASLSAGTKLYFGTFTPSAAPLEVQRTHYNGYLRSSYSQLGCNGLVDIDKVVGDPVYIGLWRTDLGQASLDGVHPSAALHQAAVNAAIIAPSMFAVQ